MSGRVIVALVFLVAVLLAIAIPLVESLLSALRSPQPIQVDSLRVVEEFLDLLIS